MKKEPKDTPNKNPNPVETTNNLPDFLTKHGITEIKDNIKEGEKLHVPGSVIFQFFGTELRRKFTKK